MKFLGFFIVLATFYLAASGDEPNVYLWARDPDAVRGIMDPQKVKVLDASSQAKELEPGGYIPGRRRDAIFHKIGIDGKVAPMDELDKDSLIMDARYATLEKLKKYHPQFTSLELRQLKEEVG